MTEKIDNGVKDNHLQAQPAPINAKFSRKGENSNSLSY